MTTLRKETRRNARSANAKVAPVASDARDWAAPKVDATLDWAGPKVDATRDWAVPKVEATRDWAVPKVESALDWAGPKVEPAVSKVKSDVLPKVAGAVAAALAASEPVREEAKSRGSAAVAALRGELEAPRPKRRRARKLFLLVGVIGAAVAGWKAWVGSSRNEPEPWATPITSTTGGSPFATPGSVGPVATADDALDDALDEEADEEADEESATTAGSQTEEVSPDQAKKGAEKG